MFVAADGAPSIPKFFLLLFYYLRLDSFFFSLSCLFVLLLDAINLKYRYVYRQNSLFIFKTYGRINRYDTTAGVVDNSRLTKNTRRDTVSNSYRAEWEGAPSRFPIPGRQAGRQEKASIRFFSLSLYTTLFCILL